MHQLPINVHLKEAGDGGRLLGFELEGGEGGGGEGGLEGGAEGAKTRRVTSGTTIYDLYDDHFDVVGRGLPGTVI